MKIRRAIIVGTTVLGMGVGAAHASLQPVPYYPVCDDAIYLEPSTIEDLTDCDLPEIYDSIKTPFEDVTGITLDNVDIVPLIYLEKKFAEQDRGDYIPAEGIDPYSREFEDALLAKTRLVIGLDNAQMATTSYFPTDDNVYARCEFRGKTPDEAKLTHDLIHELAHIYVKRHAGHFDLGEDESTVIVQEGLAEFITLDWVIPELYKNGAVSTDVLEYAAKSQQAHVLAYNHFIQNTSVEEYESGDHIGKYEEMIYVRGYRYIKWYWNRHHTLDYVLKELSRLEEPDPDGPIRFGDERKKIELQDIKKVQNITGESHE